MEAEEILAQTRSGSDLPHGWIVFPLLRSKVVLGIVGWIFGIILGLGLFALVASIVIPFNYQRGWFPATFSTILLGMFLFIGLGSIYLVITDIRRLSQSGKHIIVITPDHFVKQEGNKIILVPLEHVRHVTARGLPPTDRTPPPQAERGVRGVPGVGEGITGLLFGRGLSSSGTRWRRKRMRTPTSLAFIDTRTDNEVTVVTDEAYGDPFAIGGLLKQYAADVQHSMK
ncbi:MAG TPA: hypothetical protein VFB60_00845 [Ktedonobacteraceae bacterium]|nr:hypothetical protein [Ktedonobacteraceae bacterium]